MNFEFIKILWILISVICATLVFFYYVPITTYQKLYRDYVFSVASIPQRRVNKTIRYVEKYQNGEIPIEYIYNPHSPLNDSMIPPPTKQLPEMSPRNPHRKPLYIRDKYNPNILHKYTE